MVKQTKYKNTKSIRKKNPFNVEEFQQTADGFLGQVNWSYYHMKEDWLYIQQQIMSITI